MAMKNLCLKALQNFILQINSMKCSDPVQSDPVWKKILEISILEKKLGNYISNCMA